MAVRLRMKKLGRRHRPFYRICAVDTREPRDGRVLEELGTYDPMISDTDARAVLNGERIQHWLSVGAQPSEKVGVLIKKYGAAGTHLAKQREALDRLAQARRPSEPPTIVAPPPEEPAAETAGPEAEVLEDSGQEATSPETAVAETAPPEQEGASEGQGASEEKDTSEEQQKSE